MRDEKSDEKKPERGPVGLVDNLGARAGGGGIGFGVSLVVPTKYTHRATSALMCRAVEIG